MPAVPGSDSMAVLGTISDSRHVLKISRLVSIMGPLSRAIASGLRKAIMVRHLEFLWRRWRANAWTTDHTIPAIVMAKPRRPS